MSSPESPRVPISNNELAELVRQRLGEPKARIEVSDQPPQLSTPQAEVSSKWGRYLVYAAITRTLVDYALVPKKAEEAFTYYQARAPQVAKVVSDHVASLTRLDLGGLEPSQTTKDYVVVGKQAILGPNPPFFTTTTSTTTTSTTTPPSGGYHLQAESGSYQVTGFGSSGILAGPTVVSSSGLPPGSLELMERIQSPVRDLEVWEL